MAASDRSLAARLASVALQLLRALLMFVGAAGSMVWLQLMLPVEAIPIFGLFLTVIWWVGFGGIVRHRVVRGIARVVSGLHYALTIYCALAFGALLGWTTPQWLRTGAVVALVLWALPLIVRRGPLLVPLMLPLGLWTGGCFEGWYREDAAVRCDDYRRVIAQPGIQVLVSTSHDLATCQPGQVLRINRYPRRVWESPDSKRLIMGSQEGRLRLYPVGTPASSRLTGSVCEIAATGEGEPKCFGAGKVQVFMEDPIRDRLFIPAWGQPDEKLRGLLWELPLNEPARVLRELHFPLNIGEGYIDPPHDVIVLETDDADASHPIRASTLEILPTVPYALVPGSTRFDPKRNEGVFCGGGSTDNGGWGIAQAFQGWPLKARSLGTFWQIGPLAIGASWGCDWDPEGRRVFTAAPNLGGIMELDYDTGHLKAMHFVGFGMRDVVYDKPRNRLYTTNFLSGAVLALDATTGKRLQEWSVGRFSRFMTPTRDGKALLVASNVGVIRIPLE